MFWYHNFLNIPSFFSFIPSSLLILSENKNGITFSIHFNFPQMWHHIRIIYIHRVLFRHIRESSSNSRTLLRFVFCWCRGRMRKLRMCVRELKRFSLLTLSSTLNCLWSCREEVVWRWISSTLCSVWSKKIQFPYTLHIFRKVESHLTLISYMHSDIYSTMFIELNKRKKKLWEFYLRQKINLFCVYIAPTNHRGDWDMCLQYLSSKGSKFFSSKQNK